MQREDDIQYYYKRAETELERAQAASNPAAMKVHYLLAGYYLDRVYNRDLPPAHAG
jgi:hypothetical protein